MMQLEQQGSKLFLQASIFPVASHVRREWQVGSAACQPRAVAPSVGWRGDRTRGSRR